MKKHVASLDGLRGIAVLLVLLFHFSWSFPDATRIAFLMKRYFWAGWIGVDLFFVLSGYLITRGLVKSSAFDVKKRLKLFWARRAFRIFPLYYVVLIAGSIACLVLGARSELPGFGYWLYAQNYTLAFDPMPLRWTAHFWSLAIEEQFYFVWPLIVLLSPSRRRISVAVFLLVLCFALRTGGIFLLPRLMHWDWEQTAKLVYRATPSHMDGLLMGAVLAMVEEEKEHPWYKAFVRFREPVFSWGSTLLLGLVIYTKGFGTYDRRVMLVGYPLMAATFTAAVSLAVDGKFSARVQHALSNGVLPSCGKVSYGMYIFHWLFVIAIAHKQEAFVASATSGMGLAVGFGVIIGGMVVTWLVAQLSFRFLEAPFLKLKERFHD